MDFLFFILLGYFCPGLSFVFLLIERGLDDPFSLVFNLLLSLVWWVSPFCFSHTLLQQIKTLFHRLFFIISCLFYTKSLFLFFLFFELSLFPIVVLILGFGYQVERTLAANYLLVYTVFCSLPFFFDFEGYVQGKNRLYDGGAIWS